MNKMKQVLVDFAQTARKGNILGILQLFYLIPISFTLFITKFICGVDLRDNLFLYIGFYLIICWSVSYYIHKNRIALLQWTDSLLIHFLDSEIGQKLIILGLSIEYDIKVLLIKDIENDTSVSTFFFFIFLIGHLSFSIIFWSALWPFNIWFNCINVVYLALFFYWYRFRTSFFNYATLTQDSNVEEVELKLKQVDNWDTFILLFNEYFKQGTKKTIFNRLPKTQKRFPSRYAGLIPPKLIRKGGEAILSVDWGKLAVKMGAAGVLIGGVSGMAWLYNEDLNRSNSFRIAENDQKAKVDMALLRTTTDQKISDNSLAIEVIKVKGRSQQQVTEVLQESLRFNHDSMNALRQGLTSRYKLPWDDSNKLIVQEIENLGVERARLQEMLVNLDNYDPNLHLEAVTAAVTPNDPGMAAITLNSPLELVSLF
jgi:hypothetical protein